MKASGVSQNGKTSAQSSESAAVQTTNQLSVEQVWLYSLALAAPPMNFVVPAEKIRALIGLSDDNAESVQYLFYHCVRRLGTFERSVISMLDELLDMGLSSSSAKVLTEAASACARFLQDSGMRTEVFREILLGNISELKGSLNQTSGGASDASS